MHDPKTVAFDIKSPFKTKRGYRPSIITIWHVDPENFRFKDGSRKLGGREDDSCGWFTPLYSKVEYAQMEKLAAEQYNSIFERQVAEREDKSYAYLSNQPETTYEVIYWIWRAIKAQGKKGWQYGSSNNFLSAGELKYIMQLATAPMDNFKHRVSTVKNVESFTDLFCGVWNNYRRYHRAWYKHPRWHIHHWQIQFHPFQQLKRRYWDKCSVCGKRGYKGAAYADWGGGNMRHAECDKNRAVAIAK